MNSKKGSILIEVRDVDTGELKRTITEDNVITYGMVTNDIWGVDYDLMWREYIYGGKNTPRKLAVSGRQIRSGNQSWGYSAYGPYHESSGAYQTSYLRKESNATIEDWSYTDGAIPFGELKVRFNSPAQVDTINSVFLCGVAGARFAVSAIALNTPCIQNPGEVLDITYRIQFMESVTTNAPNSFVSPSLYKNGYIATRYTGREDSSYPTRTFGSFVGVPSSDPDNEIIRMSVTTIDYLGSNDAWRARMDGTGTGFPQNPLYDEFKVLYTHQLEKNDLRGHIIRSVQYGSYPGHWNGGVEIVPNELEHYACSELVSELVGDDFAFKPIQPIQNHNKDAVGYALDVDYLASCQGTISVNGDNWDNPDWPEFWRVEFSKTGAVGTSKYFFRNRRLLGFYGDTYRPSIINTPGDQTAIFYPERRSVDNAHGLVETEKTEEYGADSYISWDDTGINIHIVNDVKVLAYDATTTPSLPVSKITYVTSTDNGDIWISCANTGLYKLTTPLVKNTATVTKMTESTNGLFAGSESICYGLAIGYNDSVWAIFDGALSHTLNPTDATPTFNNYNSTSTTPFDYTGITDSNWSLVKYIKVDRDSPTNELAVMYKSALGIETIVWWSTVGNAITGLSTNTQIDASKYFLNGNQINTVDVSRRGSLWVRKGPDMIDQVERMNWGTIEKTFISNENLSEMSRIGFAYDYYDTPYIISMQNVYASGTTSTGSTYGPTIASVDYLQYSRFGSDMYSSLGWDKYYDQPAAGVIWQNKRASCIGVHRNRYTDSYKHGGDYSFFVQLAPSHLDYIDSLNGQYSPFEEVCWDKYHWNGSSWELNYYAPAVDSSTGTNYPAERHNFDTESHYFTGRSMIDASAAFDTNNFAASATATFVTSIQPHQKEDSTTNGGSYHDRRAKRQEYDITIFDFSTPTRQCSLMWKSNGSAAATPEITFVEDGVSTVVGTTPANISTGFYRVVVTIDGTTLNVYIDGVQLGSSITITNAYDWTNSSTDMKAFIGCRVYKWDAPQRNSPWQSNFFKGNMENIQLWNVVWDATDISNDMANINGAITSKPATNLIARYELTQSLEGLETKATHALPEAMTQGLTIAFNEGASGDSFVATDYYTFGVVDGVLKDNSMSFSRESVVYHKPVDHTFSTFKNESDTSVIEGVSTTQITEFAFFYGFSPMAQTSRGSDSAPGNLGTIDVYPGKFTDGRDFTATTYGYYNNGHSKTGHTHQRILGDGYFEGAPAAADTFALIALCNQSINTATNSATNIQYCIDLRPDGVVNIMELGVIVAANVGTYTLDSTFRVRKTGTVITYHVIVGGSESLLYTSAVAATDTAYNGTIVTGCAGNSIIDCNINYTRPSYALSIGDPLLVTGKYATNYLRLDATLSSSYAIELDGTPANVLMQNSVTVENQPAPDPFEVVIDSRSGWMIFNPADIGKTVTGRVTVIYDEV